MRVLAVTIAAVLLGSAFAARASACDYKGLARDRWQCTTQSTNKSDVANYCTQAITTIDYCASERTGSSHYHFLRMKAEVFEDAVDGFMRYRDVRDARSSLSSAIEVYTRIASASALAARERSFARSRIAADRHRLLTLQ